LLLCSFYVNLHAFNIKNINKMKVTSINRLILTVLGALCLLNSCSKEEVVVTLQTDDYVVATLKTSINETNKSTRASGTKWDADDAIGVYSLVNSDESVESSVYKQNTNIKYVTSEASLGVFTPASEDLQIRFPKTEESFDVVAYYPYKESQQNLSVDIDITQQKPLSSIDYMYAKSTEHGYNNANVNLTFNHMLSQLQMNLSTEDNISLEGAKVIIKGVKTKASMNLIDGKISTNTEVSNIVPIVNYNQDNTLSATAILMPGQQLEGVEVIILLADGKNYVWLPGTQELAKNVRYIYSLKLTNGDVKLTETNATIDDWEDNINETDVELDPNTNPSLEIPTEPEGLGDGTEEKPYSVAQALENIDKKGVWVEGYIVGYANPDDNELNIKTEPGGRGEDEDFIMADVVDATNNDDLIIAAIRVHKNDYEAAYNNLNLKENRELIGRKIKILCDITTFIRHKAVQHIAEYKLL
jgi:hypothetical protein